jgi:hypothetical protein
LVKDEAKQEELKSNIEKLAVRDADEVVAKQVLNEIK